MRSTLGRVQSYTHIVVQVLDISDLDVDGTKIAIAMSTIVAEIGLVPPCPDHCMFRSYPKPTVEWEVWNGYISTSD